MYTNFQSPNKNYGIKCTSKNILIKISCNSLFNVISYCHNKPYSHNKPCSTHKCFLGLYRFIHQCFLGLYGTTHQCFLGLYGTTHQCFLGLYGTTHQCFWLIWDLLFLLLFPTRNQQYFMVLS